MNRFSDIDCSFKRLTPVYGFPSAELVSIEKALESIQSQIDELPYYIETAKKYCHYPSEHGLTHDESASIYIYTMEWGEQSLYCVLNKTLRNENRHLLKVWFPYLKLFDTALNKLPTVREVVWRGVAGDIGKDFTKNQIITWWSVNSCSSSVDVIKGFLGNEKNSTMFLIEALNGKKVSDYTEVKSEDEIILRMGTEFRVKSNALDHPNGSYLVHLIEIGEENNHTTSASSINQIRLTTITIDQISSVPTGGNADAQLYTRVSDIAKEPQKMLMPIRGYEKVLIVLLEEAVTPLVSILPEIQDYVYVAKQRCESVPPDDLTRDESASIMLYSMEWEPHEECLYFVLNATLRTEDRQKLKPWFSYLKLILTALEKLPSKPCHVFRGVTLDLTNQYTQGKTFVWWGFSSCTTSIEVLEEEQFLGKTGQRTLFTIECDSGKDISRHSYFQSQKEVLLVAARQFIVVSYCQQEPGLHMIQLKETKPLITLLQPATNQSVEIKPTPVSLYFEDNNNNNNNSPTPQFEAISGHDKYDYQFKG
ncbi:unnamed protein product [Adineta steineri]|uniref:NAD(P)(+)--arginine ADP-ribosyltransferase n=1 Tax=Adineta steineri TaxID=433720 RepID=A0A813PY35_9BILA|nr:unnamed protein product [Adineta steineri]